MKRLGLRATYAYVRAIQAARSTTGVLFLLFVCTFCLSLGALSLLVGIAILVLNTEQNPALALAVAGGGLAFVSLLLSVWLLRQRNWMKLSGIDQLMTERLK